MNEETGKTMKCAFCGADMKGRAVCGKCGKKTEGMPDRLEVEYKDFKISEFLEIRPKYGPLEETANPGYKQDDSSADSGGKKTILRIVPIIAVAAFAAGVIYLFYRLFPW